MSDLRLIGAIIADNLTGPVDTIDEFGDIAGSQSTLQVFLRKVC